MLKTRGKALSWLLWVTVVCLSLWGWSGSAHAGGSGRLSLIGLGPGDPDLATVRALKMLEQADVVYTFGGALKDRFAEQLAGKDVRILPFKLFGRCFLAAQLGKNSDDVDASAQQRRQLLFGDIRQAVSKGSRVAIIDGGDPMIYGPWVWVLREFADLNPEVVPGVSAFNAGLAALGRDGTWAPDTHSVIIATDRQGERDRLEQLAAHRSSMVIFTHKTRLEDVLTKLRQSYPSSTPVAIVLYAGMRGRQEVIRSSLGDLPSRVANRQLPFEHILFVGDFLTYGFNDKTGEVSR
jgi:precorrin-4/cobalt-precorrin-4 C11-methyltransferase